MKTQLIQLESHDDIISIRDKMSWAKTPRILLVWPRKGRVGVRPFDLVLLRRHAESLGAELGLVTHDAEIRAAARPMALPVFSKTGHAQRKPWPLRESAQPERRAPRLDLRALRAALPSPELFEDLRQSASIRLAIFSAGVLAVLLVALFFIPSAEIRISAPTRLQSVDIAVSAEPDAAQVSLAGVIPSRPLTLALELTDSIPSSGQALVPDQTAQGDVRFKNLADAAVDVPAGTVVLTRSDPLLRFATVEAVRVPAGKGSITHARVRALAPGAIGNAQAFTVTAFEGPLGLSLAVTNLARMTGGADLTIPAPSDADRQALRERLLAKIKAQAKNQLAARLQPGDVIFTSSIAFVKVLGESDTPGPGEPGDKLTLVLRAEFRAYYASIADLNRLAESVLATSVPTGYEPVDATLNVTAASPLFGNMDGLTRWHIRASRTLRARILPAQVISLAQGQTAGRAANLLQETFGLESAPQISIQPFFWPWLPSLPFQIKIRG